jgi:hypothetical protein
MPLSTEIRFISKFWINALIFLSIGACNKAVDLDLNPKITVFSNPSGIYVSPEDTLILKIRLTALDGFQSFRIQEVSTGVVLSLNADQLGKGQVLDSFIYLGLAQYDSGDSLFYEFILIDKKQRLGTDKMSFFVANPIDTFSWNFGIPEDSSFHSFFSARPLKTFNLSNAGQNFGFIDLGFTLDSGSWLASSPADSMFSQVLVPEVGFWPILNQTVLSETMISASEFNKINTDGPIWDSFDSLVSKVVNIQENQVFSFFTVDTLVGLALVEDIQLSDSLPPSIKVSFKVQK